MALSDGLSFSNNQFRVEMWKLLFHLPFTLMWLSTEIFMEENPSKEFVELELESQEKSMRTGVLDFLCF